MTSEELARGVEEFTEDGPQYVVVCLGSLSMDVRGQPTFGCKVYGPFSEEEAATKQGEIMRLEGGACLLRPLVDLADTIRRISAD